MLAGVKILKIPKGEISPEPVPLFRPVGTAGHGLPRGNAGVDGWRSLATEVESGRTLEKGNGRGPLPGRMPDNHRQQVLALLQRFSNVNPVQAPIPLVAGGRPRGHRYPVDIQPVDRIRRQADDKLLRLLLEGKRQPVVRYRTALAACHHNPAGRFARGVERCVDCK